MNLGPLNTFLPTASGQAEDDAGRYENGLGERNSGLAVRALPLWVRRLWRLGGPGYLVAVGYMDPGNWAADIGGGSAFGYMLLSVIVISSFMAMGLQLLTARLGIATGRDLAEMCRIRYSRPAAVGLWMSAELAVAATDLAEVIGTAIALSLLSGIPLVWGVCITAADVLVILWLGARGSRLIEALVLALIAIVVGCFVLEIAIAKPDAGAVVSGLMPSAEVVRDPAMLYLAIGILGATVMPHNLYLHSASVRNKSEMHGYMGQTRVTRFITADTVVALLVAFGVNAAILIVASATFHGNGFTEVAGISQAYELLAPLLGTSIASSVFAVALLTSGLNSTITGTLAGQVVLEGFLQIRIPAWLRRMSSRVLAVVPAAVVAALYGAGGTDKLLVFSQVILSFQLPFAVIPLVRFTGDKRLMGRLVTPGKVQLLAWLTAVTLVVLNVTLLVQIFGGAVVA